MINQRNEGSFMKNRTLRSEEDSKALETSPEMSGDEFTSQDENDMGEKRKGLTAIKTLEQIE